ncbi:MAG TPA: MaoC/PaaZ C-terminal domain-containing protein [Solirubrobacterales bacterium]|jgi:acyl dehydratase|nr:MaoC/PaaZ C-terminal domain-containing protein [Solirubrobacterales bacterium]
MSTRTLQHSPRVLPLYARAAAPLIPGASLLPFIPGGGGEIPELDLSQAGVKADPAKVAAYAKVCGFALRDRLPPTYPHVLAFPLQMAVMADGGFPFGAVGLIHLENRIVQHRRIGFGEEMTIRVRPTKLEPHPKGHTFSLLTDVRCGRSKVWESESTMLRRGKADPNAFPSGMRREMRSQASGDGEDRDELPVSAEWRLAGDLGRRYASVSADRNPIHMHVFSAKPLGFPGAIAHGMWTKARCLAALESDLPDSFAVEVSFRKPIVLPARVAFGCTGTGEVIDFEVRDVKRGTPHLRGRVQPVAAKSKTKSRKKKAN